MKNANTPAMTTSGVHRIPPEPIFETASRDNGNHHFQLERISEAQSNYVTMGRKSSSSRSSSSSSTRSSKPTHPVASHSSANSPSHPSTPAAPEKHSNASSGASPSPAILPASAAASVTPPAAVSSTQTAQANASLTTTTASSVALHHGTTAEAPKAAPVSSVAPATSPTAAPSTPAIPQSSTSPNPVPTGVGAKGVPNSQESAAHVQKAAAANQLALIPAQQASPTPPTPAASTATALVASPQPTQQKKTGSSDNASGNDPATPKQSTWYDSFSYDWIRPRQRGPAPAAEPSTASAPQPAPTPSSGAIATSQSCELDRVAYQACLKDNLTATAQCDYLFLALEKCKASAAVAAAAGAAPAGNQPAVPVVSDACQPSLKAHQACLQTYPNATFKCDSLFSALEACKAAAIPMIPAAPVAATVRAPAVTDSCEQDQKAYSACLKEHPTAMFHCDFLFGALEACKARM